LRARRSAQLVGGVHAPATQKRFCAQALPQAPQCWALVRVSTSQALLAMPSQSASPCPHAVPTHAPSAHTSPLVSLSRSLQVVPLPVGRARHEVVLGSQPRTSTSSIPTPALVKTIFT
jgi:hypothetical protein